MDVYISNGVLCKAKVTNLLINRPVLGLNIIAINKFLYFKELEEHYLLQFQLLLQFRLLRQTSFAIKSELQ
jgi:hypothetical protein